jgi:hypothetical protein
VNVPSHLVPRPRSLVASGLRHRFEHGLAVAGDAGSARLRGAAERLLGASAGGAPLQLLVRERGPAESFELAIDADGVSIRAADEAGLYRGLTALAQLASTAAPGLELPGLVVRDWPDFGTRAVSLDVNRDKVPTMATLFALVDRLSAWRYNQLQLYMEHVFAYAGHEDVWRGHSPFTADEIRTLDTYCHERFIELVPNQNSLAHFHRWLVHERYRDLAEVPDGILHPFSYAKEPFSLCPTDARIFPLLEDLFDQLLPNFRSELVHVGLDEPIDLGQGRSKAACDERGVGRVFLEHLCRMRELVGARGRTMLFWADWILLYPDLVDELPKDVIACCWGYEADHPFEEQLALLSNALERHYVCPGTSSWNSIAGRTSNALANLLRAGKIGRRAGSEGYLVADWGDNGHWQPLPVSYAGLSMGAAVAWNVDHAPSPAELATQLSERAFADDAGVAGRVALALGDAHARGDAKCMNGSAPFFLLHFAHEPLPHPRLEGLSARGLERTLAAIDDALAPLADARMPGAEGALVARELAFAADLTRAGCRLGLLRLASDGALPGDLPKSDREPLAADLRELAERHRDIWLERNRPGGLDASVGRILRIADLLEPRA